ncbi:MAG: phosphodiester glycosidase family protein, partial [Thermoleophilaceae bacterium]|nr:phosphodiester glycosidase family protein [Thermoleophilaceae bacterium]
TEGRKTALLGADETGRVGDAGFVGTLALPGGPAPLDGFNRIRVLDGQVGAYTGRWGPYTRARVVEGASEVRSVLVRDGRVAEVRDGTRAGQIDAGSFELVGRGTGARRLAGLEPGTSVGASAAAAFGGVSGTPQFAVGGVAYLVRGGQITDDGAPADLDRRGPYPRVAVGFGPGRTLLLVVADGRQATSSGFLRTIDFAQLLKDLGAEEALHLDGGGSATMVARQPSRDRVEVVNSPSDGAEATGTGGIERAVPNGIGIFYDAGGQPGRPGPNRRAGSGKFFGARFVAGFGRRRLRVRPERRARLGLYASKRARVRVAVRRRGRRRVGARFAGRIGPGAVRIRLRRRLGPGRYVLRLRARTPSGRRASDRAVLRVKRRVR